MKAFIAGATGYTGQEVVAQLASLKHDVYAHVRPDSSKLEHWNTQFEGMGAHVDTTAWDESAMTETLRELQPDLVFCLIGTTKARARKAEDPQSESYMAIDYGLTALLIRACLGAEIQPRFVYLSSLGTQANSPSAYLQARYLAETELIESGLPYVIARPSFISGPSREERPMERVGAIAADGALGMLAAFGLKGPRNKYASLDAESLAAGLIRTSLGESTNVIVEAADLR